MRLVISIVGVKTILLCAAASLSPMIPASIFTQSKPRRNLVFSNPSLIRDRTNTFS
ncbi:hypothetical protein PR003_g2740 [Phytophthora rubi]|uniref:RxLR effector protein n=1 Tax=Phytophthora rubi TaxID=129364 RepID=A0A6A3NQ58_9STRA|nr:hypothetical protein PR002_g2189 [Phytophthora rubi]KAE9050621.1 hypothetical protein PR001_g2209 [Phytophthora rubi]KAE9355621.1 hypothetical protein PR003_g2740 [Phytophthora rubi]